MNNVKRIGMSNRRIVDQNQFSTEIGYLRPGEEDFRSELCLNGCWDFQPVDIPDELIIEELIIDLPKPISEKWDSVKIKIPSPWNINAMVEEDHISGSDSNFYPSYPESWKQVKIAWQKRLISIPSDWIDKEIQLHFKAVCGYCEVYLDNQKVGKHFDNSLPETYDLSPFVTPGKDYELLVGVRSPELMNINKGKNKFTYPTGSFLNMKTAGIWQDVFLLGMPKVRVKNVFIQPEVSEQVLKVDVTLKNETEGPADLTIKGLVKGLKPFSIPNDGIEVVPHYDLKDEIVLSFPHTQVTVAAMSETVLQIHVAVNGELNKWELENPALYGTLINLEQNNEVVDCKYERFGWREFKIKDGDFYLNENKIQVKGDSWHFMGIPQMTRRYAFAWYRAIKEAGGNGARLHAMPYPTFYLEVADEMGLCILDESAIWASHCGFNYDEPIIWERFNDHVARLIKRDRNYPSVMGWSVENEVMMALSTLSPTKEYINIIREKVCHFLEIARKLDPTRDWISCDGSFDWFGKFPVSMLHYVNKEKYAKRKKEAGKPVGNGEGTIAYFGTPVHASRFTGDQAYESAENRMKGVAIQAFGDLKAQIDADFSYVSIFNLAWYSLKPLPLGHSDPAKAPTVEDGIFFNDYVEGKPGVQPERLGPYCTTFNPGYDPALPLFSPWPMYEAIKDAYSPDGVQTSPYDSLIPSLEQKGLPVIDNSESVLFIGDTEAYAYKALVQSGIQFAHDKSSHILMVDLSSSNAREQDLKFQLERLRSEGGTALFSGLSLESKELLEDLLGLKIDIFEREASSLVFAGNYADTDPVVDHFQLEELYFSESDNPVIQRFGIGGEILVKAKALLKACSCEWRKWNSCGESTKTGALYRSQMELPEANALVMVNLGKARIFLSTIELAGDNYLKKVRLSPSRKLLWNKFFKAIGASVSSEFGKETHALEGNRIARALAVGYLGGKNCQSILEDDFLDGEEKTAPTLGDPVIRKNFTAHWQLESASLLGYQFKDMIFPGNDENSACYLSFYLNSPRRIDDLLTEPNVPELFMNLVASTCIRVWLNGTIILTQEEEYDYPVPMKTRLLLGKGSNHILIKIVNTSGDYTLKVNLSSTHEDFIGKLDSSIER